MIHVARGSTIKILGVSIPPGLASLTQVVSLRFHFSMSRRINISPHYNRDS